MKKYITIITVCILLCSCMFNSPFEDNTPPPTPIKYTIQFEGIDLENQDVEAYTYYKIPNIPSKEGYRFEIYCDHQILKPGDSIFVTSNKFLTVKWIKLRTITFTGINKESEFVDDGYNYVLPYINDCIVKNITIDKDTHQFMPGDSLKIESDIQLNYTVQPGTEGLQFASWYSGAVSGYTGTEAIVYIPEMHDNQIISSIKDDAFEYSSNARTVILPRVTSCINGSSFYWNMSIENVLMPNVSYIGDDAFYKCTHLTSVDFPESLRSIGSEAFYETGVKKVYIPKNVESLGSSVFANCPQLMTLEVDPENSNYYSLGNCIIRKSDNVIIQGCRNSVIPTNTEITELGNSAFAHTEKLSSITIPGNIKRIDSSAFYQCWYTESIIMEEGLEEIGSSAFWDCTHLTSCHIPDSVKKIEEYAFYHCKLACIDSLPTNLEYLGEWAFADCHQLHNLIVPGTITTINQNTFRSTSIHGFITLSEGVEIIDHNAFEDSYIDSINLPKSLHSIKDNAFAKCRLNSITIPSSVKNLGYAAFEGWTSKQKIIIEAGTDESNWDVLWTEGCNAEIIRQ